jgi:hypothetical protein
VSGGVVGVGGVCFVKALSGAGHFGKSRSGLMVPFDFRVRATIRATIYIS